MIRLSNITKTFPDGSSSRNAVLRGIDMQTEKGAFVAITGASGSGKTTLLSILGTLMRPDGGSYLLDGVEMLTGGADHSTVRNRQIGFVFQEHRLLPQCSVLDNILLPTLAAQSKATDGQAAHARLLMEMTGIAALAGRYPSTLSGGEASRTALCRALVMKPLLLLADEPTGQLDAANARNIVSLLSDINQSLGTTLVMVTHSDGVAAAAQKTFTLVNGLLR
ncbi:MAG: ABC transporter ATP-binding protein [Tannerella sp.]|jgi:ABC-type lipoprotein export system ATPase subunit|nr:ABC transporter ATP-binding protein [Tannerella sp.]